MRVGQQERNTHPLYTQTQDIVNLIMGPVGAVFSLSLEIRNLKLELKLLFLSGGQHSDVILWLAHILPIDPE